MSSYQHAGAPPPPPGAPPTERLPPNFVKYYDNENRPYYHDKLTNETHWELPPLPPPPPPPDRQSSYSPWADATAPPAPLHYTNPGDIFNTQPHAQQQQQPPLGHFHSHTFFPNQSAASPPTASPQPPLHSHHSQYNPNQLMYQLSNAHIFNSASHQPLQPPQVSHISAPQKTSLHHYPAGTTGDPEQPSSHLLPQQHVQQQQPSVRPSHYPTPTVDTNATTAATTPHPPQPSLPLPHNVHPAYPAHDSSLPPNNNLFSQPTINMHQSVYDITQSMAYMQAPSQDSAAAHIELELRAIELKKKDVIGTSDPICYLQIPQHPTITVTKQTKWKTIGKTEVQRNTVRPAWTKRFRLPYLFEENQFLRFYLVDVDNMKTERGDPLGICETTLAQVVMAGSITIPLLSVKGLTGKYGKLILRTHDQNASGQVRLDLNMAAKGLQNIEFMGKSDPFYRISCELPGGGASCLLGTSEHVNNNLNPRWKPLRVTVPAGNHSWEHVQLTFSVLDYNNKKAHKVMGEVKVSLAVLLKTRTLMLEHPHKSRKKSYGELQVDAKGIEIPTFVSFLQGGLKMKFVVAVDFTASNKPVTDPNSLHYIGDPNYPSVYAKALSAVGNVISSYIDDNRITALGFGAKLPNTQKAAFDFSLNGEGDPNVYGVNGLLEAYHKAARTVTLSGPTYFTPVIKDVMEHREKNPVTQERQDFTVLLILTDGIITDLAQTVDTIIDASYQSPMSIVIVGVGDADFSAMKFLDSDQEKLSSQTLGHRRSVKRDIVQFTKFDTSMSVTALAAEVLHEVPEQLVEYMMDMGITPNYPVDPIP